MLTLEEAFRAWEDCIKPYVPAAEELRVWLAFEG